MAFLFAGVVFCTIGGTIIGSVIGLVFGLLVCVVLPLCYKITAALCRLFGTLLTVR
jgi:hypothetical protein